MATKYEHTQKAGLPFYAMLVLLPILGVCILADPAAPVGVLIMAILLLLWGLLLMSSLTVTIDDTSLTVRFGPGVFWRTYSLSDIAGIGPTFTTYIWGWGIRWYPGGWLYNIAGFKSVEIVLKNGKKRRIGTDEPDKLAEAIRAATGAC